MSNDVLVLPNEHTIEIHTVRPDGLREVTITSPDGQQTHLGTIDSSGVYTDTTTNPPNNSWWEDFKIKLRQFIEDYTPQKKIEPTNAITGHRAGIEDIFNLLVPSAHAGVDDGTSSDFNDAARWVQPRRYDPLTFDLNGNN